MSTRAADRTPPGAGARGETTDREVAARALEIEAAAINELIGRLDGRFDRAVELVLGCPGKVVVTGIGKSGLIGQKIASTLASTGTPAFFLHPVEGVHGDVGVLHRNDVVVAISYSGETEEVIRLLPLLRRLGLPLIAMTGRPESTLGRAADVVLDCSVRQEACPFNLAPTASTTATLALGDALAMAVMARRGFKAEDFALLHPGGTLGRRLLLTVADLMHTGEAVPRVRPDTPMREVLFEISSKMLGVTGVVDEAGRLVGVITDGDLRRGLEAHGDGFLGRLAGEVMTRHPRRIEKDALAAQALRLMEENVPRPITSLFVVDKPGDDVPVGIIHLHDLLRAGV
ncbi:MAG TPA: KpsF/GutQ family sugar-phosphate isomerase [Thermodesulfobacteriota bacterium]|nr:KpsF/GutQ family sugar-phosphate isomerase [Thermodesulfobacteriota bacterium]